jgi:uncharacterized protein
MKIILSGGTGFIGKALLAHLSALGHEIVLLTRSPQAYSHLKAPNVYLESWDGYQLGPWSHHVDGSEAIINLSGEGVANKRWSEEQKQILLKSRTQTSKILVEAITQAAHRPQIVISASGAGFYGDRQEEELTEDSPKGQGFLADVSELREQEVSPLKEMGIRTVSLRLGVVLGKNGGAFKKMLLPFQYGLGGPLGSGRQWFPWIHRDDVIHIIQFILDHQEIAGPVNITAPHPVTMNEFAKTLGKTLHRPTFFKVPAFALKLLLGEMSQVILASQKVLPKKLTDANFKFQYPEIETALKAILC